MNGYDVGEITVQERAGLRERAEHVGRSIGAEVPAVAARFLAERRFLAVGAVDSAGDMRATVLAGPPGFLAVPDPATVTMAAEPHPGNPMAGVLAAPVPLGAVAVAPATRRRMRINGTVRPHGSGLALRTRQVVANCPRHIAERHPAGPPAPVRDPLLPRRGDRPDPARERLIAAADTFFVATADEHGAADISHRCGPADFGEVVDDGLLRWPDYPGNAMFMTDLATAPRAALVLPDWAGGALLALSGTATTVWPAGGTRHVDFRIADIVHLPPAPGTVRWRAGSG